MNRRATAVKKEEIIWRLNLYETLTGLVGKFGSYSCFSGQILYLLGQSIWSSVRLGRVRLLSRSVGRSVGQFLCWFFTSDLEVLSLSRLYSVGFHVQLLILLF